VQCELNLIRSQLLIEERELPFARALVVLPQAIVAFRIASDTNTGSMSVVVPPLTVIDAPCHK
jgi:hypothetical protein